MLEDGKILIGKSAKPEYLTLRLANRHGLVTGATGTGKTVTLQVLAEGFSNAGVPVFVADIKGDLSGIAAAGRRQAALRQARAGDRHRLHAGPLSRWCSGTCSASRAIRSAPRSREMGPLLLPPARAQRHAGGRAQHRLPGRRRRTACCCSTSRTCARCCNFVAENADDRQHQVRQRRQGHVGAIQRQLLVLENQGGEKFFGEPALEPHDFMQTDRDGRGMVNILAADKLMTKPRLYATFLLWLLSELFEELPEVGDLDKPKLVFFFDEAHLLFNDAPKALLDAIEQVVRLIRSKGVGVYFVTQNPLDVPRDRAGAARQPRAARAARLHAARPEGGAGRGRDLPAEPGLRHREGDHRARRRRGAGLDARGAAARPRWSSAR